MLVDVQTNCGSSAVHAQWFPTLRLEQMIVTSLYDVMRISHATVGGNYKKESMTKPWVGCCCCVFVWVFWHKCLGLLTSHRPSPLAVLVPLSRKHNQNAQCYLFVNMHVSRPIWSTFELLWLHLSWWQLGRPLPPPLEPVIEWSTDHNHSVVNCEGGINC